MSILAGFMVPHPPMIVPDIGKGEEKKIIEKPVLVMGLYLQHFEHHESMFLNINVNQDVSGNFHFNRMPKFCIFSVIRAIL